MPEQMKKMESKKSATEIVAVAPTPSTGKPKPQHPKYSEMILSALSALKKPRGASRQAIASYITTTYDVGRASNRHMSVALKSMVNEKALIRTKGVGAAGSFKINKETGKSARSAAVGKKRGRKTAKKSPKKRNLLKKRAGVQKKRRSPAKKRQAAKTIKRKPLKKRGRKPTAKRRLLKKK